jgi:hypothetical protein
MHGTFLIGQFVIHVTGSVLNFKHIPDGVADSRISCLAARTLFFPFFAWSRIPAEHGSEGPAAGSSGKQKKQTGQQNRT